MEREPIETESYKGYTINIYIDENAINPLEDWDLLTTFVTFHRCYNLSNTKEFKTPEDFLEFWKENKRHLIVLPLYIYDHSGITISTGKFSCHWDSGQLGWVYYDKRNKSKDGYKKNLPDKEFEKYIKQDVQLIDDYLQGEVFGFEILNKDGEQYDSCWGYYGGDSIKRIISEGKDTIDHIKNKEIQEDYLINLSLIRSLPKTELILSRI